MRILLFLRGCLVWLRWLGRRGVRQGNDDATPNGEPGSGSQRRKYHHFRPVLHLRHFAGDDGTLWVYDRQNPTDPFQRTPDRIGGEKFLYAPGAGDDPRDDAMERWLAEHIDGPAAEPLAKLLEGQPLTRTERSNWAAYLAVQDMRTPTAKHVLLSWYQDGVNRWLADYKANLRHMQLDIWAGQGVWYRQSELKELVSQYEVEVAPGAWTDFISTEVNRAGARLYGMVWHTVDIPAGARLPANDVGVVKCVGSFDRIVPYRIGFAVGATHWVVPLSPKKALTLAPTGDTRMPPPSVEWGRAIAQQTVADAMRFVYTDRRVSYVAEVWGRRVSGRGAR